MKRTIFTLALLFSLCLMAEDAVGQRVQKVLTPTKTVEMTQQQNAYKTAKLEFKATTPNATKAQKKAFVAQMRKQYPQAFTHIKKD